MLISLFQSFYTDISIIKYDLYHRHTFVLQLKLRTNKKEALGGKFNIVFYILTPAVSNIDKQKKMYIN